MLWIGLVVHRRARRGAWYAAGAVAGAVGALLPALLAPIVAALPPGVRVTLLGDRGVTGPALLDAAHAVGWDVVVRLNVGEAQAHRLRLADGTEWRLWDWVETVGPGWSGAGAIFKGPAGGRPFTTAARADRVVDPVRHPPWWPDRVTEYARPQPGEYLRRRRRGWGVEQSRVTTRHLDRLLLVCTWRCGGCMPSASGPSEPRADPPTPRALLIRLGWLHDALLRDRCRPPLSPHPPAVYGAP
ncbi:MAG: hypothetical protein U0031_01650 [Thermomicrobiales bacterium]